MVKAKIDRPMKANSKRMQRLAEIEALMQPVGSINTLMHVLLWGRVKSGKTRFIASGPNPVILACEDGTKTIRNFPNVTVFPVTAAGDYVPPRWKDARDFIYYLNYADHNFETVGVDTMTSLMRMALRFVTKDEELRDDLRAKGTLDYRVWNRVTRLLVEFMEDLEGVCKARNMHLIYTCQERSLKEEQAEIEGSFVPDLNPAVRGAILEKPDLIARTFIEEVESEDLQKVSYRYGMQFKHHEWPVGVREPAGTKPLPNRAFKVDLPKLIERMSSGS